MEKIYQSVTEKGLEIPLALIRAYGFAEGSNALLELGPEGIRILPARPDRSMIENLALRYLLSSMGDGATVDVLPLEGESGWQVNVYGLGHSKPLGKLIFDSNGKLIPDHSTSPDEMRRAAN